MSVAGAHAHPLARALPLFLAAGFALSSLDATGKYLVQAHALLFVVWARYVGQIVVVTPFALHRAGRGFWKTRNLARQLVRSLCLFGATVLFFAGLRYLPLAEASALMYLAPVFIVVLSGPMLGETPTRARWVAVLAGVAGTLLLLRPGASAWQPAALLVIAAALSNALYQIYTRKLEGDSAYTSLFYSAVVGTVVTTIALPFAALDPALTSFDARTLLLVVVAGLCAGFGHHFLISAYLRAPASMLSPFTYLQLVWATAYGFLVFGQWPDAWSLVGMSVVVAGGIVLARAERRRAVAPVTSPSIKSPG